MRANEQRESGEEYEPRVANDGHPTHRLWIGGTEAMTVDVVALSDAARHQNKKG